MNGFEKRLIEYVETQIRANDDKILSGTCGGGDTIDGQMVNYRAAVMLRRSLHRFKDQVVAIISGGEIEEGDLLEAAALSAKAVLTAEGHKLRQQGKNDDE
jgi:hypothetical protein